MSYFYSFIFVFFAYFSAHAKHKLTISINMDECNSCYNSLRNLQILNDHVEMEFIFKEQFKLDSIEVIALLGLEDYSGTYIWSDSVNEATLINGTFSSVSFSNSNQTKHYKFIIKNSFNSELATYLLNLTQPSHTFTLASDWITSGTQPLKYWNNYVFVRDDFKNSINKIDLITGKSVLNIPMTDSLAKIAFKKNFSNLMKWEEAQEFIKIYKLKRPKVFKELEILEDGTINAVAEYIYFILPQNTTDTIETRFYAIHQFNNSGSLENTYLIDQIVNEQSELYISFFKGERDTILYFPSTSSLLSKNDTLTLGVFPHFSPSHKNEKKYFMADFILDKQSGRYTFSRFHEQFLPTTYKEYGRNFTNLKHSYDRNHFTLPLHDAIYSLENTDDIVDLSIFKGKQFDGSPFTFNYMMNQITVDDDEIYAYYYIRATDEVRYHRRNKNTGNKLDVEVKNDLIPKQYRKYSQIDYFDPNYIIVPISRNEVMRFKVF